MEPPKLVEISRSYSYKLNAGNYESRDFFCAFKVECPIEEAEQASAKAYTFCRSEVMKAVAQYRAEQSGPK